MQRTAVAHWSMSRGAWYSPSGAGGGGVSWARGPVGGSVGLGRLPFAAWALTGQGDDANGGVTFVVKGVYVSVAGDGRIPLSELVEVAEGLRVGLR